MDPTKKDPGNGRSSLVDFKNPEHVIAALRQEAGVLLRKIDEDSVALSELSKCVALLMLVQAQGIENTMQRVRPAPVIPRIPNLKV